MTLDSKVAERFFAELQTAGMPAIPAEFSVVPQHQVIASATLTGISEFIRVFDRVTARKAWQSAALREAPSVAQLRRSEVCFFSAWDFHLPHGEDWQLIEFNDNGSGFMFAAIINAIYYAAARLDQDSAMAAPADLSTFSRHIARLIEQEARAFIGESPAGLFLILDDSMSLQQGRFRIELELLCELLRGRGWQAELGCPRETRWDGRQLFFGNRAVSFIVNRSTDFFWRGDEFSAVRSAYRDGRVYVAPNPFTYATRSDKRLLEWLSLPDWDRELGIEPGEREILSAHVPDTHLVRPSNLTALAERKGQFVFKPLEGFAGRGLLESAQVGGERLRRLLKQGKGYVAQRTVPKPCLEIDGAPVWTDLRVWAYRGEVYQFSGRASRRPDRLDLAPPGGWLPTYSTI